jgi:hypothetical protein
MYHTFQHYWSDNYSWHVPLLLPQIFLQPYSHPMDNHNTLMALGQVQVLV